MNKYLALARVSSREQQREGFSLDVQEEALRKYAERNDGEIVKFYRVTETASKRQERRTFKEMVEYAREHLAELDGLLFYKVDRAARNLFDYLELERLEQEHGLRSIFVTQKTGDGPAGRLHRRTLANMAAFQVELQSELVKEGMQRRVENGLFPGHAPYGYRNIRVDGRGLVDVHPENGPKIRRIFELYAYHNHTLDSLRDALEEEGIFYTESRSDSRGANSTTSCVIGHTSAKSVTTTNGIPGSMSHLWTAPPLRGSRCCSATRPTPATNQYTAPA